MEASRLEGLIEQVLLQVAQLNEKQETLQRELGQLRENHGLQNEWCEKKSDVSNEMYLNAKHECCFFQVARKGPDNRRWT